MRLLSAFIALFLFSPIVEADAASLGMSHDQVLADGLAPLFEFKESKLADGRQRRTGRGNQGIVMLETVGPRDNLDSATLTVGLPVDDQKALMLSSAIMLRFVNNFYPQWPKAGDWLTAALRMSLDTEEAVILNKEKKTVKLSPIKALGMVLVTVKPQDTD